MTTLIVDYGLCNLDSVARAVEECGGDPLVSDDPADVARADRIILPGVGSFAEASRSIRGRGWDLALRREALEHGIPLLGICLGMQLLATKGVEGGETDGLNLVPGRVVRLEADSASTRIPHVGWNEVFPSRDDPLFTSIPRGKDFYFVHSYHFVPDSDQAVVAQTPYCGSFVSAVGRDKIYGVQFHPEKSLRIGFQLLRNFLNLC